MDLKDYCDGVLKTESADFCEIKKRLNVPEIRLLHAAMGLCTESSEFIDAIKKNVFYGKKLDIVNLKEELGDMLWYFVVALDAITMFGGDENHVSELFNTIMERNHDKLRARYGEKFDSEKAVNRDLKLERKILKR